MAFSGRVIDDRGRPVPEAEVFLQFTPWRKQWRGGGERIVVKSKSSADGIYQLVLPKEMKVYESMTNQVPQLWVTAGDGRVGHLSLDRRIWDDIGEREGSV